jgi:cytochrome c-type biogenesis protein CcmF
VANPVLLIDQEGRLSMKEADIEGFHLKFAFIKIDPVKETSYFQVQEHTNFTPDWIVLKAIGKPFINILWLGTFILTFGFMISIFRRMQENKKK